MLPKRYTYAQCVNGCRDEASKALRKGFCLASANSLLGSLVRTEMCGSPPQLDQLDVFVVVITGVKVWCLRPSEKRYPGSAARGNDSGCGSPALCCWFAAKLGKRGSSRLLGKLVQ